MDSALAWRHQVGARLLQIVDLVVVSVFPHKSHRIERLKRRSDFYRVAHEGFYARASAVSVKWFPSGDLRVGFTVSKRHVSVKAVVRNRVKRRLRAWVDQYLPEVASIPGDFVFMARKPLADMPFDDLCQQCESVVKQCMVKQAKQKK